MKPAVPNRLRLSDKIVTRYQDSLTLSHRRFDAEARPNIERMARYFKGDQWPAGKGDISIPKVVVNLIFADVKVMLPVLALRNPRVFVKPTKATVTVPMPGSPDPTTGQPMPVPTPAQIINRRPVPVIAAAKAKEALINWRWRNLGLTRQVRRCLVDSLLSPFGIMKIGFTLETEKVDVPDQPPADPANEKPPDLLVVDEAIKAQSPYAVRWSPLDFRVDPEARYPDLSDAAWIAFGSLSRVEDIKKNPRYRNTRDLKGTVEIKQDYGSASGPSDHYDKSKDTDPEEYQRVRLWEIWDKREGRLITLADDHDKALEYRDWPLSFSSGFPSETLYFTEYPDTLYGPPDLMQVAGQQDAYNEISSMTLNHVKRFLRKYITQRGMFDENELPKLTQAIDGLVVQADGKLDDAIMAMPDAPIPVDWWQSRGNVREDHDRVSGVGDFVRGVAEKVDTATEASLIQQNLNVRTNDARDIVENFSERVARQVLHIDAQTIDMPAAIPVIGPDGAIALGQFLNVQTRDTLLAETDVEIEIGSMQPTNQAIQKREVIEIFQALRNDPMVDQFGLRRELLAKYHDTLPDGERLLLTPEQFSLVAQHMQAGVGGPSGLPSASAPSGAPSPRPLGPNIPSRPGNVPPQRPDQI